MRSLATRRQNLATSAVLADVIALLRYAGFDLIVVETAGIGQSDSEIVDMVDVSTYVMTSEYGAASQLEKIDMLDFADLIALNKFEKRGAEDALRDVRKQWRRNHKAFGGDDAALPVFPTVASRFNDPGVNRLFATLCTKLAEAAGDGGASRWAVADPGPLELTARTSLVPSQRSRYLAEIAANGRSVQQDIATRAAAASRAQGLHAALRELADPALAGAARPLRRGGAARRRRCGAGEAAPGLPGRARRSRQRWPGAAAGLAGARSRRQRARVLVHGSRSRGARRQLHRIAEPQPDPEARAAAASRLGRVARLPAAREPARPLPLHGRRLSVPSRGRGPDPDVRGRGRSGAHQSPLPLPVGGSRRGAPVDRVRFDHAVWRGPGPASRHLRAHRQLGRVDRDARRHEEAVLGLRPVRADDLGVDDHQRPGADDPRDVHEHRDRPACRAPPARDRPVGSGAGHDRRALRRPRACRATRASCRTVTTASASACSA